MDRILEETGTGKRMSIYPSHDTEYTADHIREIAGRLKAARTRGDLFSAVAHEIRHYSLFDLQIIGGRLNSEVERLPSPYREAVRPYFRGQIFDRHHQILSMQRNRMPAGDAARPIRDRDQFEAFCDMIPAGSFAWDDSTERNPHFRNPKNRLFYYLIAAFTMFVLDEPGHPGGMPFPGGFSVEQRSDGYYCLIRDKEKEIFWSICNYCPAKQAEDR